MIRCVLFDLDGTTIDTNELIIESLQHVIGRHCGKPLTRDEIIPRMGGTLIEQLRHFAGREDVDELAAAYRTYNRARHDERVTLFPGVLDTVRRLHEGGLDIGIVTNKSRDTSAKVVDLFGLRPYVRSIVTLEDVERPKPHPEPVLKAMRELGAKPEETAMVGDSPYDLLAAKEAGVTAVAVGWSLKTRDVLLEAGADRIIGAMEELLDICGLAVGGRE
jgi:pyrophosphatase PpaX